jgi:hypothetical protein
VAVAQIPKIHLRDLEDPLGGCGVVKLRLGTLGSSHIHRTYAPEVRVPQTSCCGYLPVKRD